MTLTHPQTGDPLPPVLTTKQASELLCEARTVTTDRCRRGELKCLPRPTGDGPYRILTQPLLKILAGETP